MVPIGGLEKPAGPLIDCGLSQGKLAMKIAMSGSCYVGLVTGTFFQVGA